MSGIAQAVPADGGTAGGVAGLMGAVLGLERVLFGGAGGMRLDGWSPAERLCDRCGGPVGEGEQDEGGCAACRGSRLVWQRAVSLGAYEGVLRDAVMACKYQGDRAVGRAVGRLLGERAARALAGAGVDVGGVLVVPVPTTTRRRFENRGIDHAMLLAEGVAEAVGVRARRVLERRHGHRLAGLSVADRARAIRGAVRVRSRWRGRHPGVVVLVDDVRTTGATATACLRCLRELSGDGNGVRGQARRGAGSPRLWLVTAAVSVASRRGGVDEKDGELMPGSGGALAGSEGASDGIAGKTNEKMGPGS